MNNPYSHTEPYIAKLKSIEDQINQNQLKEAAGQLNELGKSSPQDPRLFLLGSRLAEASQNPDGMLKAARKAHQLAPQWPTATLHLASVLASRDDSEEATSRATLAVQQASAQGTIDVELLTRASGIVQRFHHLPQALEWLRQAEKISPDNPNVRHKIAVILTSVGDYASAIGIFTELLAQQPNDRILLGDRLLASLGGNQQELAIQDAETLVAMEPHNEVCRFYLDVARGKTPETQPNSFISQLFDGNAAGFDRHVVVQLHYKLPRDVAQMILLWHPDRNCDVLDLGCGTGLLGACLGPIKGVLVGVDLSQKMLEQAARHNVYDSFHTVNLLDALLATPDSLYHVITALDVLIYVGNLATVVPNAHRILLPGGRFVFSCEAAEEDVADYVLHSTCRYTHRRDYVQRLLESSGFEAIEIEERVLRLEAGQPIQGFLVTARKPLQAGTKPARRVAKNTKPTPAQP
jgi:predicted TPR repeat methyltransferase